MVSNPTTLRYTVLLITLPLFFLSCQKNQKIVLFDNPEKDPLRLILDDEIELILAAGELKRLSMDYGEHSLSINGADAQIIRLEGESTFLINPTRATYYEEELMYFLTDEAEEDFRKYNMKESEVEGFLVNGNFRKIENQLLIKKTWRFDPDQNIAAGVNIKTPMQRSTYSLKKLHRAADLRKELEAETEEDLYKQLEQEDEETKIQAL